MNKSKIYKYGLFLATLLLTGCEHFLGEAPDERLTINTLEKVNQTLTSAYQNSRGYRFTHFCTDDVTRTEGVYETDPIIEDLYTWSKDIREQTHQDSPSEYWRVAYASIASVNHALEAMEGIDIEPAEKSKAEAIKGEALVMRSYCHFMLANLFCKHYDPQTAASDLGIPYVTKPEKELEVNYERGTVESTYQLAEDDLLEGIRLLEENSANFKTNKYHFTFPTVYLYASRFYTFRNRDDKDVKQAIYFAEKSIKAFGGVGVMRPWSEYSSDNYGPIDVDQAEVGMVQSAATWTSFNWVYQTTLGIATKQLSRNPIGFTDNRVDISYIRDGDIFVPAFFFVYETASPEKSAIDIFPLAEAVLNAAEGYARSNQPDLSLNYIRDLASTVYDNYSEAHLTVENLKAAWETEDDSEALIKTILFERRIQFLFKGMRWFDIRRYKLEVEHLLTDDTTLKLSEVNPDRAFQIPNYAIAAGIQPNK